MKNTVPKYQRPLKSLKEPMVHVDSWYEAIDAFDEKNYDLSIRKLLNYINPEVAKKVTSNTGDFSFEYPQGSSTITFGVRNQLLFIEAPFVKITPNTNKIALLRRVSELNFSHLTLPQIHLLGDLLWFKYETPLHLCQPNKIYDALREICITADDFDDEFIEKYEAENIQEPVVEQLCEEDKNKVWEHIQEVLSQYKTYMSYFEEKRWEGSQWDIIMLSLFQLGNMPYINGILRTDLYEYISNINNGRIDFKLRLDKGKNFFKQLSEKSKEELMKNIYHAQSFMGLKWRSSSKILQEVAVDYEEDIRKYKSSDDSFNIVYYLEYLYLRLLYYYTLDESYKEFLMNTLERASDKTYEEGAKVLLETYEHLLNETLPKGLGSQKSKGKGLFARLFG